ncbi:hypothetical protein QUF72_10985 [Desulfobacterales bacterium HSG2]|nr:hypothetical protein [Desulfobacterales bacterium HSG2]
MSFRAELKKWDIFSILTRNPLIYPPKAARQNIIPAKAAHVQLNIFLVLTREFTDDIRKPPQHVIPDRIENPACHSGQN